IHNWMIGRGALIDPFLPGEIKGSAPHHTYKEKAELLHRFHDELFAEYSKILFSPSHVMDKMKGVWYYLEQYFPDGKKMFKKIGKTQKPEHYTDAVDKVFNAIADSQIA
ncbi:MAG TPA: tRNA-dihydrouridine synthase family protein, partial [Spirochaetota bacterium]